MSKAPSRFNWPLIVAGVMGARVLMQLTQSTSTVPPKGGGVDGFGTLPAAIHETIRTGLQAVAPAPWDHVVIAVSGLLVVAAWARWVFGARP